MNFKRTQFFSPAIYLFDAQFLVSESSKIFAKEISKEVSRFVSASIFHPPLPGVDQLIP